MNANYNAKKIADYKNVEPMLLKYYYYGGKLNNVFCRKKKGRAFMLRLYFSN
jgi:hypothetical protein